MKKEKNNKPPKELPLGFVDRQEKELLVRDFIISNIKEVMIKYGFHLKDINWELSGEMKNQGLEDLENSYNLMLIL